MDAYELHDGRFIETVGVWSAANALVCEGTTCPEGRIRTLLQAWATCSVGETQDYWFSIKHRDSVYYPITAPQEFIVNGAINRTVPCLREGLEIKLFPGDKLCVHRDANTVGSTLGIYTRWIETDLPYYSYVEPQNKVMRSTMKHGSTFRSSGGISPSGGGAGPPGPVGGGGHAGGSEPI